MGSVLIAVLCAAARGEPEQREPRIAYIYPAGGQQGTVVRVTVGGQFLRNVTSAHVSGGGVRAAVVKHYLPLNNVDPEQRQQLQERIAALWQKRLDELPAGTELALDPRAWFFGQHFGTMRPGGRNNRPDATNAAARAGLPTNAFAAARTRPFDHPLLDDLDTKSLRELLHVVSTLFPRDRMRQQNMQLAEMVVLELHLAADATPGPRDLRLGMPMGWTNPMRFDVGTLPEQRELEPNQADRMAFLPPASPCVLPVVLNGQISPGDVDRFRFNAGTGQHIVVRVYARQLIPYLADAVPGWFQPTLSLHDDAGRELAFADDFRFDPDPVLLYEIPRSGVYTLEIRDALYRGREDFVYRIEAGELPFVTAMYPLGCKRGATARAAIIGWNLPHRRVTLDAFASTNAAPTVAVHKKKLRSNAVPFAVDTLPEYAEAEPNDSVTNAPYIHLPRIVNGIIGAPGDVDVLRIEGHAGRELVVDVAARTLNSPLDSLVQLTDAAGAVIAWNDDFDDKTSGLSTHAADAYLRVRLPRTGTYFVRITDAQQHGGLAYGYRVRIGPPQPDFALRVTPATLNFRAGRTALVTVHALRRDGFDGPIEIALDHPPVGITAHGGHMPAGRDVVRMTIHAATAGATTFVLRLTGSARVGDATVTRAAVPCEDMMQAFAYRHLVPMQELLACVPGGWGGRPGPPVTVADPMPVQIPAGGTARVRIAAPHRMPLTMIQFELSDPPRGIALGDVQPTRDGFVLEIKADAAAPVGYADNAIVKFFVNWPSAYKNSNAAPAAAAAPQRPQRTPAGVLPAIPYCITKQ
jgi:hypothetical protein